MENTLIKDVEEYAKIMAERLLKTKEGGMIILASDGEIVACAKIAKRSHIKSMLIELLADDNIQEILAEILNDE